MKCELDGGQICFFVLLMLVVLLSVIPGKAKIAESLENSMSLHVTARSLHVVARLLHVTFLR
jgi:hypothetical protein